MTTSYRHLAALAVGATFTLGLVSACATPHTPEGYVSELRATMTEVDAATVTDQQLIYVGSTMCAHPEMLNGSETDDPAAMPTPEYAEYTEITRSYCDVLPAQAPLPIPAAETASAPLPPAPITVGVPVALNYGGDDNPVTVTVNSVERCRGDLVLDVTLETGTTYSAQDGIAQTVSYTDTGGITRMAAEAMPTGSCYADYDYTTALPYAHERQPGKTYQGKMFYTIGQGEATTLELEGTDGLTRTLDVTGK